MVSSALGGKHTRFTNRFLKYTHTCTHKLTRSYLGKTTAVVVQESRECVVFVLLPLLYSCFVLLQIACLFFRRGGREGATELHWKWRWIEVRRERGHQKGVCRLDQREYAAWRSHIAHLLTWGRFTNADTEASAACLACICGISGALLGCSCASLFWRWPGIFHHGGSERRPRMCMYPPHHTCMYPPHAHESNRFHLLAHPISHRHCYKQPLRPP